MLRSFLAAFSATLLVVSTSAAAIVGPGDSVPNVNGDVFTWSASAPNSTFALWNSFNNFPGGPPAGSVGGYGPGVSPLSQTSFSGGGLPSALTFNSFGAIVSSGNAYGGAFGPVPDPSLFLTDATATVRSGTDGGDFTRIVAQWETLGSELDYDSILLSLSTAAPGMIAPSMAVETARSTLDGTFGGTGVSYLALWDLPSSQADYRFDFQASSLNMSIDNFRIDSFVQSTPFSTPTAIPEPGSVLLLSSIGVAGLIWRRRRRAAVSEIAL
jgi:hypothetical protein